MKSLPTSFVALSLTALCATSAPVRAQTAAISLTHAAPASLRLRIAHATPLAGRVHVVRLSTGQTLFTETFEAPAYGHRFDFNQAPSGRYLVWLQTGATVHRCLVRVHTRAQASTVRVTKLITRPMPQAWAVGHGPSAPVVAPAVSSVAGSVSHAVGQPLE